MKQKEKSIIPLVLNETDVYNSSLYSHVDKRYPLQE